MPTVRCKCGKGNCTWADDGTDRVLVVLRGHMSLVTARTAASMAPLDDEDVELEDLDLPAGVTYEELVDMVFKAGRTEHPRRSRLSPIETLQLRALEARLRASKTDAESDDYFIVSCSPCDHLRKRRVRP